MATDIQPKHILVTEDHFKTPTSVDVMSDHLLRIHLVGDPRTGKYCLAERYCSEKYSESNHLYFNNHLFSKRLKINGKLIELMLTFKKNFDCNRTIDFAFSKPADATLFVFDVTDRSSFENIKKYVEGNPPENQSPLKFLVATKVDLVSRRVIFSVEAIEFANPNGFTYVETSSKRNFNVSELFARIIEDRLKQLSLPPPPLVSAWNGCALI